MIEFILWILMWLLTYAVPYVAIGFVITLVYVFFYGRYSNDTWDMEEALPVLAFVCFLFPLALLITAGAGFVLGSNKLFTKVFNKGRVRRKLSSKND